MTVFQEIAILGYILAIMGFIIICVLCSKLNKIIDRLDRLQRSIDQNNNKIIRSDQEQDV